MSVQKNSVPFSVVGKSEEKIDARALSSGRAHFTDDFTMPGLLQAKILWSPYAHALIEEIDIRAAEQLSGVAAVLCHTNVPRISHTSAGQGYPEPSPYDTFLFDRKVRYVGDRVAVVAATDSMTVERALSLIKVTYRGLEPLFDPGEATATSAPVVHDEAEAFSFIPHSYQPERNIAARVDIAVGELEAGFQESDYILENQFSSQYVSHCMTEPHVCLSYLDEQERLVIITSTQVPFHARRIVARCLELPVSRVRVIKPRIGGGFGGKQEVFLEGICGLLTLRTGKPVRLALDRKEVFISSRTRHPQTIRIKSGVKKDGAITAIDMKVLMNSGAYGAHALTVLMNTGSKSLPLYHCPHVRFHGTTVYTNLPVGGAFRGYGAPQGHFALQVQIDEMAEKISMDTLEFIKRNHLKEGESSPLFKKLGEGREGVEMRLTSCKLSECIDLGAKLIGWQEKRGQARQQHGRYRCGVGVACLMQGSSIPEVDMAGAIIKMNDDGSFNLLIGATDLGTGSDTILAQIAAEVLAVPLDKIIVYSSDTDFTPFDTGAYASSTTYLSGEAVRQAALKARGEIVSVAALMLNVKEEDLVLEQGVVHGRGSSKKVSLSEIGHFSLYQRQQRQIVGTASCVPKVSPPPFAAHFAEVAVDTWTGKTEVVKYVAVVDCGTAINPRLAEGQTEGAIFQGLGQALYEEMHFGPRGSVNNPNFHTYTLPRTWELPELVVRILESYEPTGPFGAKSVSEISTNGPMPAISNGIYDAVGIRLREAPFTPEKVWRLLNN